MLRELFAVLFQFSAVGITLFLIAVVATQLIAAFDLGLLAFLAGLLVLLWIWLVPLLSLWSKGEE